jgi:hypothetical protein
MTGLSPAQAIVKAFDDRYELLGPLEDDWQEQCLAAALRAAAKQSTFADVAVNKTIEVVPVDILLAIATELENHQ